MSLIVLHRPIASINISSNGGSNTLERVHMFPGRHLGQEEFQRQQAYTDARLAPLLKTHPTGILHGLTIIHTEDNSQFVVNPGLALTHQGQTLSLIKPLKVAWQEAIENYLQTTATSDASGLYYLILQQAQNRVDSPSVEPCQRAEFDPTRDSRLVNITRVALKRLAVNPALISSTPPEQLQNQVVADRIDAQFLKHFNQSVPLALVAISSDLTNPNPVHTVQWVSQSSGRYEATANSGYHVLLNQTSSALRKVMQLYNQPENQATPLGDFLNNNLNLNYLPAVGQLPTAWLQQPAATPPQLLWLQDHIGVDMVPIPEESVAPILQRHIARRVIDLTQASGDKIRLLLALKREDYRADLLDIPPTDAQLESDIYRFYMRAYNAWHRWRQQFDKLYFIEPSNEDPITSPAETAVLEHAVLDPEQFKHLDLPKPSLPPITPANLYQNVIARASSELQDPNNNATPYPYDNGVPAQPEFYSNWLVIDGSVFTPPPVPTPEQDGLVIQYAVALVELEAIENRIRAIRTRLEKTRDYLLLQRQQLDSQTVALSSLAGGVAGDGNGMQVARWLPYASLNTDLIPEELSALSIAPSVSANVRSSAPSPATEKAGSNQNNIAMMSLEQGFGNNLLSAALNTSASTTPSYLTSKPQSYSAFELGINKKRLDLLANLAKSSVSKPAFQAKEFRFGVLDHISPEINEYRKAYYGMQDLLSTLSDLFDATDAAVLRKQLRAVMKTNGLVDPQILEDQISDRTTDLVEELSGNDNPPSQEKLRGLVANQKRYGALFTVGKVLTQWIAITEARYNKIERQLQGKLRQHTVKLAQIEKLSGMIRVAREALENLDRFFDEQVGDYGVAQRLLEEDWRQTYDKNRERSHILNTGIQGLYYVRVRNTSLSAPLADPLSLRYSSATDIVPGCDSDTDVDLPDELQHFFEATCEIPMDDWASLKPLQAKLPPFHRFDYLNKLRVARFQSRPKRSNNSSQTNTLQARLHTVHVQTQSVINQWATLSLPTFTKSSVATQKQAAKVFSLEDLTQGSNGYLRKQAQTLQQHLEQCLVCIIEKLNQLPGSIRLQWGQLAEDNRIKVENVAWWPALDRAEQDDFNATRTLAELIAWWFRQLSPDASSTSRNAMTNMIRAALIFSSLGDPQEIVRGKVFAIPRTTQLGERFKVKLNRMVQPGTRLQLLNEQQQVTAELSVEDHSPDNTQVRIVHLVRSDIRISHQFSVVGNTRRRS